MREKEREQEREKEEERKGGREGGREGGRKHEIPATGNQVQESNTGVHSTMAPAARCSHPRIQQECCIHGRMALEEKS